METKVCFKCKTEKPLLEFYKHPQMGDGHLNKCKECAKKDSDENFKHKLETDPTFKESEKIRAREKFHRLYSDIRPTPEYKAIIMKAYKERYPEKQMVKNKISGLPKLGGRSQRHHWNYDIKFALDFIILEEIEHRKLHRYMIYDQERMMYRTTDGILLDTKEKHIEYYNSLKDKP